MALSVLAYTLARTLDQQAVVERNFGGVDEWGADRPEEWKKHLQVPCRLYWDRSSGVRAANQEYVSPARTVPLDQGGIILERGIDVTEDDRIANVLDAQGNIEIPGLIEITAVVVQDTHIELSIEQAHLGQAS